MQNVKVTDNKQKQQKLRGDVPTSILVHILKMETDRISERNKYKKLDIPFDGIEIDGEKAKLAKPMIEKNIYNPFREIHRKPAAWN